MKTAFRESFARDLRGVRNEKLLLRVKESIEAVEKADSLNALPNLKKLKGAKNYFRLKLGDYRIGLALENNTVVFVRFLDRKDIYKYFP
ncbi:MAG TPA: type II toxin-antitoxin system RelE/ParE family toxin [Pyrinomonadaceae bacterium]|nr:type II toxin-antitoxin system RelE/ParE family toxin [Pyrinomonadaceae bacterium]